MQNKYYDEHYAAMMVQPIEVDQAMMSPEAFHGLLLGNAAKYHIRAGQKQGENVDKEYTKRDRYIAWMFHATRGAIIDPNQDYDCPLWYKQDAINRINQKVNEMQMARKYGEKA